VRAATPKPETGWFGLRKAKSREVQGAGRQGADGAIPIRGISGELPVRFAPDGGAVPGDRIVGIMTPGEGITIYPIQSPALKEFEDTPERWLDVRWDIDEESAQRFPARIQVNRATSRARSPRSRR
jgi:(p)ppGpp synthase/HD superfamily hydrolase